MARVLIRALTALALLALGGSPALGSDATTEALSSEDRQCLACHGREGFNKRFGTDEEFSLKVDGNAFGASVHAPLGCTGCHSEIDAAKHPAEDRAAAAKFTSAREFIRAQARGCRNCHAAIADAWATSSHGRVPGGMGPNCVTCHKTHAIRAAAASASLNSGCLDCHPDIATAHEAWLPNTKTHFETVSCAACHSPGAGKGIELRLFDPVDRKPVSTASAPATLVHPGGGDTPIDAKHLARLMRGLDEKAQGRVMLRGRIQVRSPADSHRLHEKGKALKDCAVCHSSDADAFRQVKLSLVGPDGKQVRFEAKPEVLRTAASLDWMPGFYAIGGTRIGLLDTLLGFALVAGIGAPALHLLLRRALRTRQPAAGTAAQPDEPDAAQATPPSKKEST